MAQENEIKQSLKKLYDGLKLIFSETPNPSQKFNMTGTLDDGTPVMIEGDMPNVGAEVIVQNPEGAEAPIADGEYVVKVGEQSFKIKTVGGKITESEAPEAPPAPANEEMENEKIKALEERIAALEKGSQGVAKADEVKAETDKVREITVTMSKQIEKLETENKTLKVELSKHIENVEAILNKPEAKPTHTPTQTTFDREKFRKENGLI